MTIHDGDEAIQTIDLWISELTGDLGRSSREDTPAMEANIIPPYVREDDAIVIEEPIVEEKRPRILDRLVRKLIRPRY